MKKLLTFAALALAFVGVALFGATQAQAEGGSAAIDTYTPHLHKTVVDGSGNAITNWDYTQNPFTFEISSEAGAPLPAKTTATTDANGNVAWGEVEFTEPGLYTYEIKEVAGSNANITYDTSVHKLTVNIEAEQPPVVEQ